MLLCEYILNSTHTPPSEDVLYHTLLQLYLAEDLPPLKGSEGGSAPSASPAARRCGIHQSHHSVPWSWVVVAVSMAQPLHMRPPLWCWAQSGWTGSCRDVQSVLWQPNVVCTLCRAGNKLSNCCAEAGSLGRSRATTLTRSWFCVAPTPSGRASSSCTRSSASSKRCCE